MSNFETTADTAIESDGLARRCDRVQRRLPARATGELSHVRRRLTERHLRRCDVCADEAARQATVAADLATMAARASAPVDEAAPPPELLARLLADAQEPGLRQRVAVPARGAVSGARPGLSAALILTIAALLALAAWSGWRIGRGRTNARPSTSETP